MIDSLMQDFRYALRQLRKSPGFTVVAVLTLALGIGATVAIFSLADAVLLRPLQFANQDRLVEVFEDASKVGFPKNDLSPANYLDYKQRNHVFSDMAAIRMTLLTVTDAGRPEQLSGLKVSSNLFPMLGVSPILGRSFLPEEDRDGGPKVAVISAGLWQRRFGSDTAVIGRDITLDYESYRIV